MSDEGIELKNVELIEGEVEICVNETFEFMQPKNFAYASALFIICNAIIGLSLLLSPSAHFVDKRLTDTNERTKELNLALRYSDLKYYHRSISFGLQSIRNRGKPLVVVVSGNIKLRHNSRTIHEVNIEEHVYRLPIKQIIPLFSTGKLRMTDIIADLDITMTEGRFKDMYLIWHLENSSWIFFVFLLRTATFIVALYVFLHLSTRIYSLKKTSATYTQRFLVMVSFVFAILWAPIPELRYFDMYTSFTPIFELMQTINSALFVYMINFVNWDLDFRFTDTEAVFVRRSILMFVVSLAFLSLPKAIKYNDTIYTDGFEVWLPLLLIILTTLNMLRFPMYLDSQTPEFQSSFAHLFIGIPPVCAMFFNIFTYQERNSKMSVFSHAMNTITFLFLVLLHWPRDEAGFDKQYITPDLQHGNLGDMSDDVEGKDNNLDA